MRRSCLLLIALLLAGCSGIETETLREKSLLLQGMRSYQWAFSADDLAGEDSADADSPQLQLHAHFQATVDRLLAAKGYQKRVSGADMELDYRILVIQEKRELYQADEITAAEYGIEWRFDRDTLPRRSGWKHEEPGTLSFYQKGRLVLAAIDTRTGKAIWLRSADKALTAERSQRDMERLLDKIAAKLLKPFPARQSR